MIEIKEEPEDTESSKNNQIFISDINTEQCEDVSNVAAGWKKNRVPFDTVLNQVWLFISSPRLKEFLKP